MKAAFLLSIAINLFLIEFLNTPTRIDEFYTALMEINPNLTGDLVLASGAAIVIGLAIGAVKAVKK